MVAENLEMSPPSVLGYEIELPKYKRPGEPEHYHLSAAGLGASQIVSEPTKRPVHFWFRTRYVFALAICLSHLHPHILELHLRPSTVTSLIVFCIGLLPGFIQFCTPITFPEWFLPNRVVLKQQKEGEEEMIMAERLDSELKAHDWLKPLQGAVIPTCFGQLYYSGTGAPTVEYLEGVSLSSPEGATLRLEELSTLPQPCYRAPHVFGVHHDDPNRPTFCLWTTGQSWF